MKSILRIILDLCDVKMDLMGISLAALEVYIQFIYILCPRCDKQRLPSLSDDADDMRKAHQRHAKCRCIVLLVRRDHDPKRMNIKFRCLLRCCSISLTLGARSSGLCCEGSDFVRLCRGGESMAMKLGDIAACVKFGELDVGKIFGDVDGDVDVKLGDTAVNDLSTGAGAVKAVKFGDVEAGRDVAVKLGECAAYDELCGEENEIGRKFGDVAKESERFDVVVAKSA